MCIQFTFLIYMFRQFGGLNHIYPELMFGQSFRLYCLKSKRLTVITKNGKGNVEICYHNFCRLTCVSNKGKLHELDCFVIFDIFFIKLNISIYDLDVTMNVRTDLLFSFHIYFFCHSPFLCSYTLLFIIIVQL